MRTHLAIGFLTLVATVASMPTALAQCAAPFSAVTSGVSTINFTLPNGDPHSATSTAIGIWSSTDSGCDGMGGFYPDLTSGAFSSVSTTMNVALVYHSGVATNSEGRCGVTTVQLDTNTNQITGATVEMWETQVGGSAGDCIPALPQLVAHEIGHVLGLQDAYAYSQCNGTIMGNNPSFVSSDQCAAIKDTWYTPTEEHQDDDNSRLQDCESRCASHCEMAYGGSYYCPVEGQSPIIFDLNDDGYNLTDAANGVWFDLNADGRADRTAWTTTGSDDAFLCRDRDGNGSINDGGELFGNSTPLADGTKAPNGFVALAEFDRAGLGGNGDGILDARDRVWASLLLWRDVNHDGISQKSELRTLAAAGVKSIDLHYIASKHTDQYGNVFRYRSKAIVTNGKGKDHPEKIYDVFFVVNLNARPAGN